MLENDRQEIAELIVEAFYTHNRPLIDDYVQFFFPDFFAILPSGGPMNKGFDRRISFRIAIEQFVSYITAEDIARGIILTSDAGNESRWIDYHGNSYPSHFARIIDRMNRDLYPFIDLYAQPSFGKGFDDIPALKLLDRQKNLNGLLLTGLMGGNKNFRSKT